ncbi:MAG TPA: mechanosensitive ion channel domain-containing protein [Terriglobia bacterium]|nr:mechanosensitive ion channel domain-containing protein [Terriglobia bacterium]
MLPHLARLLHLPPLVAYVIALAAVLLGALIFGLILHRAFHRLARRLKGAWGEVAIELLESLALPLLVVGALDIALELLELPRRYERLASKLILAVILGVVFNFLARAVALSFRSLARKDPNFLRITQPATLFVRVLFAFLAFIIFLENLGVSLTAVWTTLGVGSVAIGLALQATLANLFAAITILADRPVSPGDHVTLSSAGFSVEGEVVRIGWRATALRTATNEVAFVPNSMMAGGVLTNYSLAGPGAAVSMTVKVNASSDIEKVEASLAETAKQVTGQFKLASAQEPQVALTSEFTDPFLQFSLKVPVPRLSDRDQVAAALRKEITKLYRQGDLKGP